MIIAPFKVFFETHKGTEQNQFRRQRKSFRAQQCPSYSQSLNVTSSSSVRMWRSDVQHRGCRRSTTRGAIGIKQHSHLTPKPPLAAGQKKISSIRQSA